MINTNPNYIPQTATWRGETIQNTAGHTNEVLTRRKLSLEVNARADPGGRLMKAHIANINAMRAANTTNNSISINTPTQAMQRLQNQRVDAIRALMAENEDNSLKMTILEEMLENALNPPTSDVDISAATDSIRQSANAFLAAQEEEDVTVDIAEQKLMAIRISNRIANGDTVPHEDHQFLLEFNPGMYQLALAQSLIAQNNDPEDYDSLSGDDESSPEAKMQQLVNSVAMDSPQAAVESSFNEIV
ncbi:MAG: hypothetical protein FWC13_08400 [Oscillospiraceae bacterium]|nr:hypothetical protein [Oscillospiraceae bacterium]